jgi:hypothetical protein
MLRVVYQITTLKSFYILATAALINNRVPVQIIPFAGSLAIFRVCASMLRVVLQMRALKSFCILATAGLINNGVSAQIIPFMV